ncbi:MULTISPECIES: hypothetical protein [Enterobacter cloacae complex]|uniref:hypothetical protein n=1 Tax=Enterobacter cloacae complex TaxID=354276 RepID=UPI0015757F2A|nr:MULTISPECIES: hypothetical protein [Enterobacter cloacae complex]MBF4113315.1 hypothetical protein [Enterobacter cloacae]NQF31947.1 hypothetical protein [Enterobacter asburiae]HCM9117295.1 hypothetical protein [Enterobacter asburiae]
MLAKYEEKTYESYFNSELDKRSSIYFPFGQVQEGGIGADSAAMSKDIWIWRILGFRKKSWLRFSGIDLMEVAKIMNDLIEDEIKNIPSIKTNLLFQYKRPELITTANGKEWFYWNQEYYRYPIYKEQQILLEKLDKRFGTKALILYASPAIYDINDLVQAKINGTIIESTNFCKVNKLKGHHRNTYIKSGNNSFACSEPEELPHFDLLVNLVQLEYKRDVVNTTAVLDFTSELRRTVEEDPYIGESFRALLMPYQERELDRFKFLYEYIAMAVFRELTGIQWLVSVDSR